MEQSGRDGGIWARITERQGDVFYTKKGLPFTYYIKGGELFASRRERSITRSTFEKAYERILSEPERITGPKKLNVYGAPYVYAILTTVMGLPDDAGRDGAGLPDGEMREER